MRRLIAMNKIDEYYLIKMGNYYLINTNLVVGNRFELTIKYSEATRFSKETAIEFANKVGGVAIKVEVTYE